MTDRVHLDIRDDGVAVVTLDHPPLNVYDLEMRDGLIEAITAVRDTPDLRCMVLRAAGTHFSAGADLSEFGSADSIFEGRRIRWDRDPWVPLSELSIPTVAELHGYAVGSGLEMSLLCDLRVASDDVVVGLPETKLGMLPAAGGTQSLTRAIGADAAAPVVLTGRNLDASEAVARGIVHHIVDRGALEASVDALALQLAAIDAEVMGALKRTLRGAYDLPLADGLELERRLAVAVSAR